MDENLKKPQDRPYKPTPPNNDVVVNSFQMPMFILPCRIHQDDISGAVIVDDHGYQHLNLPCEADRESAIDWFRETWVDRLKADVEPVIIVSRIHEEEEGQG